MCKSWIVFAPVLAVSLVWSGARPAKAQVLVVTAKSVDSLVGGLEHVIASAAPDEEMKQGAQQGLDLLKDPTLLPGIDRAKPFGAWVTMPAEPNAADPPTIIAAVPVTDIKALMDGLKNFGIDVNDKPGIPGFSYAVGLAGTGMSLYAVEGKGYVYLTIIPQGAEKLAALTPADWVPKRDGLGDLSAGIRMDLVPDAFKDMLLEQVEGRMKLERNRMPGEDDATFQGRLTVMKLSQELFTRFVREARDLNLDLAVDRPNETLSLEVSLGAVSGTPMAKRLAGLSGLRSGFQVLADSSSAIAGWAALPISAELRDSLGKQADDAIAKALAQEKNPTSKALIERAKAILDEFIKSDSLDAGVAIREVNTPANTGTSVLVAGLKVPDARKVEDLVRDVFKANPPAPNEAKVTLDAGKAADGTALHRIEPVMQPEEAARMPGLGEPIIYLAFRKNQVLAALGANAEAAIVKALAETEKVPAENAAGSPVSFRMAVDRVAKLSDAAGAQKAELAKLFTGKNAGKNQMGLSLGRGGDDSIRVRLQVDLPALAALARLGAIQQQAQLTPAR